MQEQSRAMLVEAADFLPYIRKIATQTSPRAVDQCANLAALFEDQTKVEFSFPSWTYEIDNPTSSPFCSKSFANSANKKAFRCFDCMQIDTALFCYDCFVKSNHKGHTFRELEATGGCCDCGDSELWNSNGFCPDHSAINKSVNIKNEVRQLFLKELKFIFYAYFWCAESITGSTRLVLGNTLFDFVYTLAQKNYQTKMLITELLNSSLEQDYRPLICVKKTILSTIFHLPKEFQELKKIQSIAFEMYSIESFRSCILSEYFKLNATNTFTWDHPIKNFNFQYLTCIKAINKLLAQGKLEPLQLDPTIPFKNTEQMVQAFKKYYEDLNYLRKMKESKQYNIYHYNKILANDMAFYRSKSRIEQKEEVVLDDYFLKSIAASMHDIIDRTDILVKNIQSLFNFIVSFNEMTYSLAQERAFALFIMAFLKGNLEKINEKDVKMQILDILNINPLKITDSYLAYILERLIKKHLKNVAKIAQLSPKSQKNSYQKFFFSVYTEKEYPLQLDFIYQKILMTLGKDYVDYWKIVSEIIVEQNNQEYNPIWLSELSLFISNLFTQDLNELTVANSVGFPRSQQITQLYLKILTAYAGKFNIRQLKCLSGYFINNPQILQQALENHTALERSKMIVNAKVQPLDKLVYMNMIKEYKFYEDVRWANNQRLKPVPLLREFPTISEDVLHLQCQNTIKILKMIPFDKQKNLIRTLEKQVSALLQLYLLTQAQSVKQFFNNKLTDLKVHLHPEIINHLKEVCKDKAEVMDQIANQEKYKEDQQKKKRQKIENKKREKQLMMKKNQEAMLKQYNAVQVMVSQHETCIYCRQDIKEDYHLLSYVSLTNLISKFMIKENNNIHFFLTTCGHKVHEECYNKYVADKAKEEKCPYCKKRTNICLQNVSNVSDLSQEQRENIVSVFFDSICATLMEEYTQLWSIYEQFYEKQHQGNILSTIITSLAREVIYYGLHNFESFKKHSLSAYQATFKILSLAKKSHLKDSFAIIEENMPKSTHVLAALESYAYKIIRNKLFNQQQAGQVSLAQAMTTEVQKIISLVTNPNSSNIQISNLSIITIQSLFWTVPQSIKELHSLMQQCPICGKLTNWIYICLICNWKACNKENKAFHEHSKQQHTEGSVFISAGNGKISLVSSGQVKNEDSYYENIHGQLYNHTDENSKKGYTSSFKLNQEKMAKVFKDLISHNLHNIVIN